MIGKYDGGDVLLVSSKRVAAGGVLGSREKVPVTAWIQHPAESGDMISMFGDSSDVTLELYFTAQTEISESEDPKCETGDLRELIWIRVIQ